MVTVRRGLSLPRAVARTAVCARLRTSLNASAYRRSLLRRSGPSGRLPQADFTLLTSATHRAERLVQSLADGTDTDASRRPIGRHLLHPTRHARRAGQLPDLVQPSLPRQRQPQRRQPRLVHSDLPQRRLILTPRQRQCWTARSIRSPTPAGQANNGCARPTSPPPAPVSMSMTMTLDPTTDNNPCKARASSLFRQKAF